MLDSAGQVLDSTGSDFGGGHGQLRITRHGRVLSRAVTKGTSSDCDICNLCRHLHTHKGTFYGNCIVVGSVPGRWTAN